MKYIFTVIFRLLAVLVFLFIGEANAQRVYSVVFSQLPKDNQLYARDENNMAEVPISGVIEIPDWHHFSVVVYRNGERVGYEKSVLNYGGKTTASFEMKPSIKAEIADYSFEVFACKQNDSLSMVKRNEVVAGDFYVISGQSNASATIFGNWSSKYARTIARIPDNNPAGTLGDTLWIPSAWSWTYVGAWGLELQRSILEKDSIPTCIINGSIPGKKLAEFLQRDESNPADPYTLYGSLLNRVRVAKPTRIRAFFWMHGEQEIFEYIDNYPEEFDLLYKNWQKDYPSVEEFIVVQTNVIVLNHPNEDHPVGGEVRDFLRRTKYLYEKTDHFTPIATPGYDGVHYTRPGFEEFGRRVFNFIRPKFYNSPDNDNVSCPDIINATYTSDKHDEILLTFDEGQELKWANDTTITGQNGQPLTLKLKDFFYLDGDEKTEHFASGKVEGNKVRLTLKEPKLASKINYLPSFIIPNLPEPGGLLIGFLSGPFLTNKRGLGAFSFHNVSIDPSPVLGVEPIAKSINYKVYPNPSSNLLMIDFPEVVSGKLKIVNMNGREFYNKNISFQKSHEVNIIEWPSGLYLLSVENQNGIVSARKIIKQ